MARAKRIKQIDIPVYVEIRNGRKRQGLWMIVRIEPGHLTAGERHRPTESWSIQEQLQFLSDEAVTKAFKTVVTRAQLERAEAEYRLWCEQNPIREK